MRIGVISDTHRKRSYTQKAANIVSKTDMIFHLGDNVEDVEDIKKIYTNDVIYVKGNCDFSNNVSLERIVICDEKRILVTHGHKYDVKEGLLRLKYRALEVEADIVVYGHTHIARIDFEQGIFFVNPGSPSLPRNGSPSVAILEISSDSVIPYILQV